MFFQRGLIALGILGPLVLQAVPLPTDNMQNFSDQDADISRQSLDVRMQCLNSVPPSPAGVKLRTLPFESFDFSRFYFGPKPLIKFIEGYVVDYLKARHQTPSEIQANEWASIVGLTLVEVIRFPDQEGQLVEILKPQDFIFTWIEASSTLQVDVIIDRECKECFLRMKIGDTVSCSPRFYLKESKHRILSLDLSRLTAGGVVVHNPLNDNRALTQGARTGADSDLLRNPGGASTNSSSDEKTVTGCVLGARNFSLTGTLVFTTAFFALVRLRRKKRRSTDSTLLRL